MGSFNLRETFYRDRLFALPSDDHLNKLSIFTHLHEESVDEEDDVKNQNVVHFSVIHCQCRRSEMSLLPDSK